MSARVNLFWRTVVIMMTSLGLLASINQFFYLNIFGISFINNSFLYLMLAFFLPLVFIIIPATKKKEYKSVPWYDLLLFCVTIVVTIYFSYHGSNIINQGWEYQAPLLATIFSFVFWVIVLEALRRTAGKVVAGIALFFSLYPLFTGYIPIYFLQGVPFDFITVATSHSFGASSIMGIPLQAAGTILIGFLLFGVVLQHTGGSQFFYNVAQAMFGRMRGGSAKVSIVSSSLMGMMSGSAVSNVLTTGPMTIPAMKKDGFESNYAASVEATASTGGTITPPIMGSAAFIMVSFLGIPYGEIVIAAAIPAFLYYLGIFIQVDAFAAKNGFVGSAKANFKDVIKHIISGWPFILSLILLIYLLVIMRTEIQAPYIAVVLLLVISLFSKNNRLTWCKFIDIIFNSGKIISEILGIIAGVGLIVGGLSITGVSFSLSRELVALVGDNVLLILIAGAITCFILGMGMTVSAVYVFLAIVMAPPLIELGVHPIAAHLFVIYWATVSYITPPVALASFSAAGIAGADPIRTSLISMKLGSVKYFIPFFFAYNPVLLAQGSLSEIAIAFVTAVIGVFILACGLEGYMVGVGVIKSYFANFVLVISGLLILFPGIMTDLLGLLMAGSVVVNLIYLKQKAKKNDEVNVIEKEIIDSKAK